jgi:hypothetical protein
MEQKFSEDNPPPTMPIQTESKTDLIKPLEPSKNKGGNFLIILLSILLIISSLIAGLFAYQTQKLVKEISKLQITPTPAASTKPSPTIDPTLDWKTYTKDQISFKYPNEWTISEQQNQTSMENKEGAKITIKWNDTTTNKPCTSDAQTVAEILVIDSQLGQTGYCVRRLVTEIETINTAKEGPIPDSISSIKIESTTGSGHSPSFTKNETIIKQILSTFKFIEVKPITSPQP